jgi:hypothetical protein
MDRHADNRDDVSHDTHRRSGKTALIAGVEVRDDDLESQQGLHMAAVILRISSVVILLLALWQFADWWMDRPPGDVGLAVLVSDTIRLIVVAALLWAGSNLADLMIKSHYDLRAGRILLARQTYMMRQMGIASGALPATETDADRRGITAEKAIPQMRKPRPEA